MGKIIEKLINRFDGAIADDPRSGNDNQCAMVKHFDLFTYPHKLVPYGSVQDDTSGQSKLGNLTVGSDGLLYGLGTDPNNVTLQKIFVKSTPSDPTSAWTGVANTLSGKVVNYKVFVEYKDYFYTLDANRYVMRFDRTGIAAVNTTYSDLTSFTNTANGVVHPKDDILYIPYDNKIWSLNGHSGTPTVTALTLPSNRRIVSIAPYGNYLAIATVPTTGGSISQHSMVYLWDRDSSLTTLSESIDWGNGYLGALNSFNGVLIGVSTSGANSIYTRGMASLQIKIYAGGTPQLVKEVSGAFAAIYPLVNFVNSDKFYFSAKIYQPGGGAQTTTDVGIWSVYKSKITGQYVANIERLASSTNAEYANGVLAAAVADGYMSAVYDVVGTVTITTASGFTNTSVYESLIHSLGDASITKKLIGVTVMTEPLPAAGQVVLKYRVNENISGGGTWTTLFTHNSDNSISHSTINVESTGATLSEFKEVQFRIESTGGAVITGLKFKAEVIDKDLY